MLADQAVQAEQAGFDLEPAEILSKYTVVNDAEQMIAAYRPLVTEIGAE